MLTFSCLKGNDGVDVTKSNRIGTAFDPQVHGDSISFSRFFYTVSAQIYGINYRIDSLRQSYRVSAQCSTNPFGNYTMAFWLFTTIYSFLDDSHYTIYAFQRGLIHPLHDNSIITELKMQSLELDPPSFKEFVTRFHKRKAKASEALPGSKTMKDDSKKETEDMKINCVLSPFLLPVSRLYYYGFVHLKIFVTICMYGILVVWPFESFYDVLWGNLTYSMVWPQIMHYLIQWFYEMWSMQGYQLVTKINKEEARLLKRFAQFHTKGRQTFSSQRYQAITLSKPDYTINQEWSNGD